MGDERIYVETMTDTENLERHISRYEFANNFISPNSLILDIACGSGYGSNILSKANNVIGIDNSQEAIEYAKKTYKGNINFICTSIEHVVFEEDKFDAIVCLETLEHLYYSTALNFLLKATSWVRTNGVFILSSPMLRYKDGKSYITNPFHVNEMPRKDLLLLLNELFYNYSKFFFHQEETKFLPLNNEDTGFLIMVARKKW